MNQLDLLEKLKQAQSELDKSNESGDLETGMEFFNRCVELERELMRANGIDEERVDKAR